MSAGIRNTLIVFAIAAAVNFTPGGGTTADVVGALLSIAITVAFVLIGARVYRENRVAIFSLGDQHRGLLYGALGVAVFAMAASTRLWASGPGTLLWVSLIAGASYAIVVVYRYYKSFSF